MHVSRLHATKRWDETYSLILIAERLPLATGLPAPVADCNIQSLHGLLSEVHVSGTGVGDAASILDGLKVDTLDLVPLQPATSSVGGLNLAGSKSLNPLLVGNKTLRIGLLLLLGEVLSWKMG